MFGKPLGGFPGWVWFSIPLTPDCPVGGGCGDPNTLLGFPCGGNLFRFDRYGKFSQVYRPPFLRWELAVGNSYLFYLQGVVPNPSYEGLCPFCPTAFEFKMGRAGWTWVGMPGLMALGGDGFMDAVKLKYPSNETGSCRTAQQDYNAVPNNWLSWGWLYWNTWLQAVEAFTPHAPFGHNTCYPWMGYRVWVMVGSATDEDDPHQVTLIWPET